MDDMIIDFYGLSESQPFAYPYKASNGYYPEKQVGYINYSGVKYLYNYGLQNIKTAQAMISLIANNVPAFGWGLGVVAVASTMGGKSNLEKPLRMLIIKRRE